MSLLAIDTEHTLHLAAQELSGASVAVLGVRGSGKSNTAAVLIEELLPSMPLTVVDIEGEYWGVRERFEILVVGRSEHVDLMLEPEQAASVAPFVLQNGLSVILDLSDFSKSEAETFLLVYFTALWNTASAVRRPHQIVLEEAHEFVPQGSHSPLKDILTRIALRGRKRGLGIVAVSQRSAKVDKDVLTQSSLLFLHRVIHSVDLAVYKDLIPLPGREVEALVRELRPGQAVVLRDNVPQVVQIRPQATFHAGATPDLTPADVPQLRTIDTALLNELQRSLSQLPSQPGTPEDLAALHAALERALQERDAALQERDEARRDLEQARQEFLLVPKDSTKPKGWTMVKVVVPLPSERLEEQSPSSPAVSTAETQPDTPVTTKTEVDDLPIRSSLAMARSANRQRRRFDRLVADLKQERRMYRDILALLIEREGEALTLRDLARRLGLREITITKNPPASLVRAGLIERTKLGNQRAYCSHVRVLFVEEYPDLDAAALVDELLSRL